MVVHLLKLAVGVKDLDDLVRLQESKVSISQSQGRGNRLWHRTRHMPRREKDVLQGGSIYWIIKGFIRARQRIIGLEAVIVNDGTPRCDIILDTDLVKTEPQPRRPHQGWRYLTPNGVPKDLNSAVLDGEMPEEMVIELGEIGLI